MPWLFGELPCALLTEGFVLLSLTPTARGNVLPLAERGGRCENCYVGVILLNGCHLERGVSCVAYLNWPLGKEKCA